MSIRRSAVAVPVVLGLLALGGCGQPRDLPTSDDGVVGTVVAVSDVSGIPDAPDPDGWVVTLPTAAVDDVLALAGEGTLERELRYSRFTMAPETVDELGGTVAEVDGAGRFRLDVVGERLVCRLSASRWNGEVGAAGCVRADLPAGGVVRVTLGEAGLAVEVET
ncbi:hypothetical protein [Actinotalea ferrariae]|uniref:hypothetical protein n=1 Tax=Actinotalea ferrariae TaxID=1386098 RepID=UPI0015640B3C|nr:hypothetical protein [Actinotalea ferrariae]